MAAQNAQDGVIKKSGILTSTLLLVIVFNYAKPAEASSQKESTDENWDMVALKRRGIISENMDTLDELNAIPKGLNLVDITLNGNFVGSFQIQANDQGTVCFTPEMFESLGLIPPEVISAADCYDWIGEHPDASIAWQPETQTLSIVVPPQWLQQDDLAVESGGTAAHVNYNSFTNVNTFKDGTQRYSWLSLNSGINVSNWLLRSQQNIQDEHGKITAAVNSTYLEHYFGSLNRIVQAGEINAQNTLFSIGLLKGVQLFPDGMHSDRADASGVEIDGIANTPQARVEVRQYDRLIYSTLVPAGPFHLTNIPVQNVNAELQVTVVETQGETHQFVVPVTQLAAASQPAPQGYSVAMGKLKNYSDSGNVPALLTMNHNWRLLNRWSLRSGVLFSDNYQSVAASVSGSPESMTGQSFHLQALLVQNRYQHNQSVQLRAYSNHDLGNNLSLSLGVNKNTAGFLTLVEAASHTRSRKHDYYSRDNLEVSVGLGWTTDWLGTLSVNHTRSTTYSDEGTWRYYMINWNRRFSHGLLLTASAAHGSGGTRNNNSVNINFSWPLGEKRFRHYYRAYDRRRLPGTSVSMPLNSQSELQLAVEEEQSERNRSLQASLSNDLRYTNVNLNLLVDNKHYRNYSVSTSGSVVAHKRGITFSNNPVQSTYGLIKLSDPLAGIPVNTPGGTAWTDWRGMAVIPSLAAWHDNAIDIDVERLPKNADVSNGHRTLRPAYGTVKTVNVAMLTGTRLLMTISLADGRLLPKGSTVWDDRKIVAEAVDDGVVFIENAANEGQLHVKVNHSTEQCDIRYRLPPDDDPESLYQQLALTCE